MYYNIIYIYIYAYVCTNFARHSNTNVNARVPQMSYDVDRWYRTPLKTFSCLLC